MGVLLIVVFFLAMGAAACLGWWSVDQICDCAAITESKVNGVMGLSAVTGFVVGLVLQVIWG
jgi:hypothetical protein